MSADNGMLFEFPDEKPRAFWMRNTLIPLDIVYFDANKQYVSHTTMQPCIADPCKNYPSTGPAKYALEVNAGIFAATNLDSSWTFKKE